MNSQRFSLYPYQASYYNWLVTWDAGYVSGSGVPATAPGFLGTISPSQVSSLGLDQSKSFASYLGWPTNLPFNTSRRIYLSTSGTGWDNFEATLIYQNYWGTYFTQSLVLPTGAVGAKDITLGYATVNMAVATDTTYAACQKFFYPNRLIDLIITSGGVPVTPTAPLYIDFGAQGMVEFNIQESVRYASNNFTLEVLTDGANNSPVLTTQYAVLASNYPRFVYDNQMRQNPSGPLVLSDLFYPFNSVATAFNSSSTPTSSTFWLATEDFNVTTLQSENAFIDLSSLGGPLNVLVDISNQRRNPGWEDVDPGPANQSNLLFSLIQNGITT